MYKTNTNNNNKKIVEHKLDKDRTMKNLFYYYRKKLTHSRGFYSDNNIICDKQNKIGIMWNFRAACTITLTTFFYFLNVIDKYKTDYIHNTYRGFKLHAEHEPLQYIQDEKYDIVKVIINPFQRAVSSYLLHKNHNLSFRQYLTKLLKDGISFVGDQLMIDHTKSQYIDGEEKYVSKYLKIDKNEKYTFKLLDGNEYLFDPNKTTSQHHSKRKDINYFVGDLKLSDVKTKIPKSYKKFYDDEIKEMVSTYFKDDIEKYNYTFDELK